MRHLGLSARALKPWRAVAAVAAIAAIFAGCGPTNGFPPLSGEFAYVANAADGSISVFSIDATTGALTLVLYYS
jgi:hypothetical protein